VYRVQTEQPIGPEYAETFAKGIYFAFEGLTTQPARLEVLTPHSARLSIVEGRYHQVKRMFGYFQNKVIGLHRERIGELVLDERLRPGEYRALTGEEVRL
jgi:16S rRNA pseudouridine516 synthase